MHAILTTIEYYSQQLYIRGQHNFFHKTYNGTILYYIIQHFKMVPSQSTTQFKRRFSSMY